MRTPSFSLLSSALLLVGGAVAGCNGKQADDSCLDASFVALSGNPAGTEVKHGNGQFVRNEHRPLSRLTTPQ